MLNVNYNISFLKNRCEMLFTTSVFKKLMSHVTFNIGYFKNRCYMSLTTSVFLKIDVVLEILFNIMSVFSINPKNNLQILKSDHTTYNFHSVLKQFLPENSIRNLLITMNLKHI